MFHKEFYPTPRHVIERMGIDSFDRIVLEPSAGKGDIIDFLNENGAREVLACEINSDLRKIIQDKCRLIADDFFKVTAEQVSHVQLIVMNPPFSNADKHILHAWNIAPEGCEIIALCNWQTLDNKYSYSRSELNNAISTYGSKENLGDCFNMSERQTNVEVGLLKLFKPIVSESFDYDGFFYEEDENVQANGIMRYDEIRAIVNSYLSAVQCFERFSHVSSEMNSITSYLGFGSGFSFNVSHGKDGITTKDVFSKELQRHCWKFIFNKMGIEKYVTKGVMAELNNFIESHKNYPFTMRNIYRMLTIIAGTRENTFKKTIIEAIDKLTRYTHENRYGVEGWKTNDGHLLARKFISGYICEASYVKGLSIKYYQTHFEYIIDLTKALCFLTGTDYNSIRPISESSADRDAEGNLIRSNDYSKSISGLNQFEPNTWYKWGFFEFKVFKKGSGHFKFKDEKVWETLNRTYAKYKGQVLPEKL